MTGLRGLASVGVALSLAACSSTPPPPDWQMNAKGAMERAAEAYLSGNSRLEAVESARARTEVSRTGRADLMARAELMLCAVRVASLVFEACPGYAALSQDAAPAERAYADYLAGKVPAGDAALLPAPHRDLAGGKTSAEALSRIADPLSRLVAAGVLMRSGRASPAVLSLASDTASAQGWVRPLVAWLQVQVQRAEAAGAADEAARLRRRIALALGPAPSARAASAP